ncbi:MAG: WXG100 family type VII secretion target [Synergistaceae bacterium]|nr:WXG100 family type VII secretion target [Synergistaceae bacterium]MBQ9905063.1 WXG100 family type VII secretion target [Synergistaceae bacterium]
MPVIKLTPELLEEGANRLTEANNSNENVINRLDGLISSLNADWEGEAYNAFKQSYDNKRKTFVELSQEMEKFVLFLKKFADVMRQEEKRQASAAINLG